MFGPDLWEISIEEISPDGYWMGSKEELDALYEEINAAPVAAIRMQEDDLPF